LKGLKSVDSRVTLGDPSGGFKKKPVILHFIAELPAVILLSKSTTFSHFIKQQMIF
jgi:hypothetical protein